MTQRFLNGEKKVCGVLAEMNAETDALNFVNLEKGINTRWSDNKKSRWLSHPDICRWLYSLIGKIKKEGEKR